MDDILITCRTIEEHLRNPSGCLDRLQKYGVRAKIEKSDLLKEKIEYLGYEISKVGVLPNKMKSEAIVAMPRPRSTEEVATFLGMAQYYSAHIPNFSAIAAPLHDLKKKEKSFIWTSRCEKAFAEFKRALIGPALLMHFDELLPIGVAADASQKGIGAVLFHVLPDNSERPIYYASRTLSSAERNYSQVEREALAIIFALKNFIDIYFDVNFDYIMIINLY